MSKYINIHYLWGRVSGRLEYLNTFLSANQEIDFPDSFYAVETMLAWANQELTPESMKNVTYHLSYLMRDVKGFIVNPDTETQDKVLGLEFYESLVVVKDCLRDIIMEGDYQ